MHPQDYHTSTMDGAAAFAKGASSENWVPSPDRCDDAIDPDDEYYQEDEKETYGVPIHGPC